MVGKRILKSLPALSALAVLAVLFLGAGWARPAWERNEVLDSPLYGISLRIAIAQLQGHWDTGASGRTNGAAVLTARGRLKEEKSRRGQPWKIENCAPTQQTEGCYGTIDTQSGDCPTCLGWITCQDPYHICIESPEP